MSSHARWWTWWKGVSVTVAVLLSALILLAAAAGRWHAVATQAVALGAVVAATVGVGGVRHRDRRDRNRRG